MLTPIPAKRYFTIGEVGDLCGVKPHVLRYWEQEFTQLRPMKRRGNRRYYQHHEVLMIRRIRDLLYDQGFTISGARNKLDELVQEARERGKPLEIPLDEVDGFDPEGSPITDSKAALAVAPASEPRPSYTALHSASSPHLQIEHIRTELIEIRNLLLYG